MLAPGAARAPLFLFLALLQLRDVLAELFVSLTELRWSKSRPEALALAIFSLGTRIDKPDILVGHRTISSLRHGRVFLFGSRRLLPLEHVFVGLGELLKVFVGHVELLEYVLVDLFLDVLQLQLAGAFLVRGVCRGRRLHWIP